MKKVCVIVGILLLGNFVSNYVFSMCGMTECAHAAEHEHHEYKEKSEVKEYFYSTIYTCPMHPEVQSDKSGKCLKCGMKLEKKQVLMTYACPEKDCEYQKATLGKCPKHKKELVKCEIKSFCPKCGEQVNPEELIQKPVKIELSTTAEIVVRNANEKEIGKEVICPVMKTKFNVKPNTEVAEYKGNSYYFCCPKCLVEFKKLPDKYIE